MIASRTIRAVALGAAVVTLALAFSSATTVARTTAVVGDARIVVETVRGTTPDKVRTLAIDDKIFANEEIRTGPESATEITLLNGASLTMGANSGLAVTSLEPGADRVVLSTNLGVFRFASASSGPATYEIRTPVATIEARNAVFSMAIDVDGTTTVVLEAGEMTMVNLVGDSLEMRTPGLSSTIGPPAPGAAQPPPSRPGLAPNRATSRIEAMNRAVAEFAPLHVPAESDVQTAEAPVIDNAALAQLIEKFAETDGSPEAIAALAEKMIGELEGDPLVTAETATLIGEAASRALNAVRLAPVAVGDGFTLPPQSIGWDFGPAGSPLQPGFRRITPENLKRHEPALRGIQGGTGGDLLSDGIMNVRLFGTAVRNGTYRLIVLTKDLAGQDDASANPLGHAMRVNGTPSQIVRFGDNDRTTYLATPEPRTADLAGGVPPPPEAEPSGIVTMVTVEVINGGLTVELLADDDERTYIAGLILEPIDEPSALTPDDLWPDAERRLAAEARIASAIGDHLDKVATAAGDEPTRRRILNLPNAPLENTEAVSAS